MSLLREKLARFTTALAPDWMLIPRPKPSSLARPRVSRTTTSDRTMVESSPDREIPTSRFRSKATRLSSTCPPSWMIKPRPADPSVADAVSAIRTFLTVARPPENTASPRNSVSMTATSSIVTEVPPPPTQNPGRAPVTRRLRTTVSRPLTVTVPAEVLGAEEVTTVSVTQAPQSVPPPGSSTDSSKVPRLRATTVSALAASRASAILPNGDSRVPAPPADAPART